MGKRLSAQRPCLARLAAAASGLSLLAGTDDRAVAFCFHCELLRVLKVVCQGSCDSQKAMQRKRQRGNDGEL